MTLLEMNHFITATKTMLTGLLDTGVIDDQDSRNLLPVIVGEKIKRESIVE